MARIAVFGTGLMGEPMAQRLLSAGHSVTVVGHRNRRPVERLVHAGATEAASPSAPCGTLTWQSWFCPRRRKSRGYY